MAAGVDHNAHVLALQFRMRSIAVRQEVAAELDIQAQLVARALREKVAKHRSQLVNSIVVETSGTSLGQATAKKVIVGAEHGWYVEKGVKPGGKGLPRFFDPASADAVAWLRTKLRAGGRISNKPRRFSRVFQAAELALRDAYEGWAWHVRHKGVKAQPFVEPTARAMAAPVAAALRARAIAAATRATGSAA